MKTLLFSTLLTVTGYWGFTNSNYFISFFTDRRCTGSAYCSACTNCSGCKHCAKGGGSCGVCSSSPKKSIRSKSSSNFTRSTPNINRLSFSSKIYTTTSLNLRSGPGTHYKIKERLSKNKPLKYLETTGSWLKVYVINSGNIGYVYFKYIK